MLVLLAVLLGGFCGTLFGAYLTIRAYHDRGPGVFYKGGIVPSEPVEPVEPEGDMDEGIHCPTLAEAEQIQAWANEGVYTGPGGYGDVA